jgi:hypothetical protein
MSIKGKAREQKEFVKKTGFFEGEVVAINPDREKLEKILGTTLEKDPEYLSKEEKDGKEIVKCSIVAWIKDVKSGELRNIRFFLKDVLKENKDKTKRQYINDVGMTTWADSESNLQEWFKSRPYRVAHEGEEELYNFAVTWLNKLDTKDTETVLSFDWSKLMKGNVKEIESQIHGEYCGTLCCLVTMRTVDKEGQPMEYEQVYNKEFLPGYTIKQVRMRKIDASFIEGARNTEKKKRSKLQKFVLSITDSQYGIKDQFTLGELTPYDPAKNITAGNKVISDEDTSY